MVWSWATEYGDPSRKAGGTTRRSDDADGNPLHQRVLQMQATAGNAAVGQMLRENAGGSGGTGDSSPSPIAWKPAKPEILRYGSRGESVKRLQESLNRYGGGSDVTVDGIMGPLTTQALRHFQKDHPPLAVDGTAGPDTWAELERVGDEGAPMPGATAKDFLDKGRKLYAAGRYSLAFDEFAKAYQMDPDASYLFNMAQSLWLAGGRNAEAIKLYERYIAAGPGEAAVANAKEQIQKLRGPSPTGDAAKDQAAADELNASARKYFLDADFARAYDEFTKAYTLSHDPTYLYNRASSLRAMGGQRGQALALLEQFVVADVSEDKKAAALEEIKELRDPGPSGDKAKDDAAQDAMYVDAKEAYFRENFAKAYDLFSRAWSVRREPATLWNRAQCLRMLGGRREEAIKLYQEFLALDVPENAKKGARVHIAELKGPEKATASGRAN